MTVQRRSGAFWRLAFAALCTASGLGLLGTRLPWLEIFSHFQLYAVAAWLVALLCFVALPRVRASFWRPRRALTLAAALALAHLGLIAWLWLPSRSPALDREPVLLEVLCFNMQHDRAALDGVLRSLQAHPPDVLVLTETIADMSVAGYEHVLHDKPDTLGIWSRHPLEHTRATLVDGDRDQLSVTVMIGRYRLPLLAVHWRMPMRGGPSAAAETSARLAGEQTHLLMLGDFNSSPWSPRFARLRDQGLRRADQLGARGTWAFDRFHLLSLPIDHFFTKGDIRIEALEFLPWTASDHRPLLARVACAHRR